MAKEIIRYSLDEKQLKDLFKTLFAKLSHNYSSYKWVGNPEKVKYTEDPLSNIPVMQMELTTNTNSKNSKYSQISIFFQVFTDITNLVRCSIKFKEKTGGIDFEMKNFKIKNKILEDDQIAKILFFIQNEINLVNKAA